MNLLKISQLSTIVTTFVLLTIFNISKTDNPRHMRFIPYDIEIDTLCEAMPKPTVLVEIKKRAPVTKIRNYAASAVPISRRVTKKKTVVSENFKRYGYLIDLANSDDFESLSNRDKYRAGLYVMATLAKKRYPKLGIDTLDLAVAFSMTGYLECKNKVGNAAVNRHSDARGVWQFMPRHRKKYGVPENVHMLELHEQIPYMWKYFCHKIDSQWTNDDGDPLDQSKIKEWIDVYCLIFAPKFADDGLDAAFYRSCNGKTYCGNVKRKCAYHGNKGYDHNNDGAISKRDIRDRAIKKHFTL